MDVHLSKHSIVLTPRLYKIGMTLPEIFWKLHLLSITFA